MRQTKKGNAWYFGMKVHVGTDTQGLVHSLLTTDAAQADVNQLPGLIHGDERELYGDGAYWNAADRRSFVTARVRYQVNRRGHRHRPLTEQGKRVNQARSRGLAKNTARAYAAFALANLYLVRQRLLPSGA